MYVECWPMNSICRFNSSVQLNFLSYVTRNMHIYIYHIRSTSIATAAAAATYILVFDIAEMSWVAVQLIEKKTTLTHVSECTQTRTAQMYDCTCVRVHKTANHPTKTNTSVLVQWGNVITKADSVVAGAHTHAWTNSTLIVLVQYEYTNVNLTQTRTHANAQTLMHHVQHENSNDWRHI